MTQLTVQLLPLPEDQGSNPDIQTTFIEHLILFVETTKIKEKEADDGPLKTILKGALLKVR